jgi:tetratricopeptide (TPR) repeat protein
LRRSALLLLAGLLASCASPPPQAPIREGEDYVFPAPRAKEASREEEQRLDAAWRRVLAGQTREAEADYRRILTRRPGFLPAETGLAYARLRAGRLREASDGFRAVLSREPRDFPALLGAASTALRLGDPESALGFYRLAQAAHPDDATTLKRLAEVKLQVTERRVAAGRGLVAQGKLASAAEEYRQALDAAPELGGLRVELAELLLQQGDASGAAATLAADPLGDRQVQLRLGQLLAEQNDLQGALEAYRHILTRDPRDAEARRGALDAREALELASLPEEYKRIPSAPRITRADLAALVSQKVTALARVTGGEPEVAVDISGSWARPHILKALSLDILKVYPNHTFQPGATVRRGDLARAVARVLDLLDWPAGRAPEIADMTQNNLFYDAAMRAVAAGLMDVTASGGFEPWRPVSGRDALDVIEALTRLVGP